MTRARAIDLRSTSKVSARYRFQKDRGRAGSCCILITITLRPGVFGPAIIPDLAI